MFKCIFVPAVVLIAINCIDAYFNINRTASEFDAYPTAVSFL